VQDAAVIGALEATPAPPHHGSHTEAVCLTRLQGRQQEQHKIAAIADLLESMLCLGKVIPDTVVQELEQ